MRKFGLLGFPLSHSFSKRYFTEKFREMGIQADNQYDLYEIEDINSLSEVLKNNPDILGLNVTIPHKLNIIPLLDKIDPAAQKIGAVNVIKVAKDGKLIGYNSDYFGIKRSLEEFLGEKRSLNALILGNGGATKAVAMALEDMKIPFKIVSRQKTETTINYREANELLPDYKLIINCTPLGTYPNVEAFPDLDYENLTKEHFCHDLVYNPSETRFMLKAKNYGAQVKNGYDMLVYQAEKSWEIWNG
ncbi:MAG: shikimate dehydrogenase [Bacteroidetes bacterium]|nr:shikimate dehydrogenase [Bacteroidota bacterium]